MKPSQDKLYGFFSNFRTNSCLIFCTRICDKMKQLWAVGQSGRREQHVLATSGVVGHGLEHRKPLGSINMEKGINVFQQETDNRGSHLPHLPFICDSKECFS